VGQAIFSGGDGLGAFHPLQFIRNPLTNNLWILILFLYLFTPRRLIRLEKQMPFNQRVQGSSPCAPTNQINGLLVQSRTIGLHLRLQSCSLGFDQLVRSEFEGGGDWQEERQRTACEG
jgi:hypothetical protein